MDEDRCTFCKSCMAKSGGEKCLCGELYSMSVCGTILTFSGYNKASAPKVYRTMPHLNETVQYLRCQQAYVSMFVD